MRVLEAKSISISYGKAPAVRGICFGVETGSIVSLIGSNGAGKTTILKSIIGLTMVVEGQILFQEESINSLPTSERVKRGIALCPEGRRVFPEMTVAENLKLGAFLRRGKSEIARDLMGIYDFFPILEQRKRQVAGSLSGGEQQMLAIGRALMVNPILLLLDEPSLGLAPLIVKEIWRIVKEMNGKGISIILVEQNALAALKLSSKGYILENGRIVLEGESRSLLDNESLRSAYLGE
jgi:branched-chain amino acid transport system ATP-binding protein